MYVIISCWLYFILYLYFLFYISRKLIYKIFTIYIYTSVITSKLLHQYINTPNEHYQTYPKRTHRTCQRSSLELQRRSPIRRYYEMARNYYRTRRHTIPRRHFLPRHRFPGRLPFQASACQIHYADFTPKRQRIRRHMYRHPQR